MLIARHPNTVHQGIVAPSCPNPTGLSLPTADPQTGVQFMEQLGKGAYGEVWRARYRGKTVAAKITHCPTGFRAEEVGLLRAAQGPHTVKLLGEERRSAKGHAIIMELCHGSLNDWIQTARADRKAPAPKRLLQLLERLCQGLKALHGKQLVYGDLKPDNLLVNESGLLVFSDFGDGRGPQSDRCGAGQLGWGHPDYHAKPDVRSGRISSESDMWMLAQTAIHFWTREAPALNPSPVPADIPLRGQLQACLAASPSARPSAAQLLEEVQRELKWIERHAKPAPKNRMSEPKRDKTHRRSNSIDPKGSPVQPPRNRSNSDLSPGNGMGELMSRMKRINKVSSRHR